ncbi:MAG: M48 family metalloprotease [Pseudoxanthomonas suwonensis]|nr:M48 family metalloprotease [Pseudoxanthomonas suwonensis]
MNVSFRFRTPLAAAVGFGLLVAGTAFAQQPARVHKPKADVHAAADLSSPKLESLARGTRVQVTGQQGLWYRLQRGDGSDGFVRINDLRMQQPAAEASASQRSALFGGGAGRGRVAETATVRGINAGQLRAGGSDTAALRRIEGFRVDASSADAHARQQGWQPRAVPWSGEAQPTAIDPREATRAERRERVATARGVLSAIGGGLLGGRAGSTVARVADRSAGKSEAELMEEELALGPALSARILAVAPPWDNPAAQRRLNLVGRWLASRTSRPDLPWTFAVIDDGEANAFAAPGGYVLVTRGLYELLADDSELAAVLAHELSHVVQRDHYEVIRKQQVTELGKDLAMAQVRTPGALGFARSYVERHGAAVLLSSLDRDAEYRSDHAAGIYLARTGFDPLAFYSVLQKLTALGSRPAQLAQLYATHPPLEERLDRLDRQIGADAGGRGRRR